MSGKSGGLHPFERLHPAVQYHVVNSLGWTALRPLQERAIAPLLDSEHVLLIAPTAGGKTEAAILPVLSRMLTEEWRGISVLYVCPIKALLNNLEPRLSFIAGLVGRRVGVWHGDVAQRLKSEYERELPDVLLTTPESLEGILLGSRRDHRRLLGDIRCVIADELHAFAADDRGWHLLALLERVRALDPHAIQRIGLSATVGNPEALLQWFTGHVDGAATLVQISAPPVQVDLSVDYVGSIRNAALLLSQLHGGEKRLIFCDSRSKVEELAVGLRERGVEVFVSHASLSADIRRQAEQAFSERQNCVIVATSTLELGLDVGDLDRVIQIDAPASVASFLQRLGRTGRRAGSHRNLLFVATSDAGLLEALAIARLFREGFVEPVSPPPLPYGVLVQQLFATLVQHARELEEDAFISTVRCVPGFADAIDRAWEDLRRFLVQEEYLVRTGAYLSFGPRADRRFNGKGLADLCVSFDSPRMFAATYGTNLVGNIDPLNLVPHGAGPCVISLGGRSWQVVSVDQKRARLEVVPSEERGKSRWLGAARGVSRALSQAVQDTLTDDTGEFAARLSQRARARLDELRMELEDTLHAWPVALGGDHYVWWTYAGLAANAILAGQIATAGGGLGAVGSWSVKFRLDQATLDRVGGWQGLTHLEPDWKPTKLPKFADLLPVDLVRAMSLERARSADHV